MSDAGYTVHFCPPAYPRALRPFSCRHDPIYQMVKNARIVRGAIELDSPMCMACGAPLPGTFGGNVLGCIVECYSSLGWNAAIGSHLIYLRERYMRIAVKLFGQEGWNGRHRKWAELIDPNLTMRMRPAGQHPDGTRFFSTCIDLGYFNPNSAVHDQPFCSEAACHGDELPAL